MTETRVGILRFLAELALLTLCDIRESKWLRRFFVTFVVLAVIAPNNIVISIVAIIAVFALIAIKVVAIEIMSDPWNI